MPTYEFICRDCSLQFEKLLSVGSLDAFKLEGLCEACDGPISQQIRTAPATVIPPHMQAGGTAYERKMKYYGIKNISTGEGITKNTNVTEPPGVRGVKPIDPK